MFERLRWWVLTVLSEMGKFGGEYSGADRLVGRQRQHARCALAERLER